MNRVQMNPRFLPLIDCVIAGHIIVVVMLIANGMTQSVRIRKRVAFALDRAGSVMFVASKKSSVPRIPDRKTVGYRYAFSTTAA